MTFPAQDPMRFTPPPPHGSTRAHGRACARICPFAQAGKRAAAEGLGRSAGHSSVQGSRVESEELHFPRGSLNLP